MQRDSCSSALNYQYQQKLPLKVGTQKDQAAKLTADHRERKEHLKRESRRQE